MYNNINTKCRCTLDTRVSSRHSRRKCVLVFENNGKTNGKYEFKRENLKKKFRWKNS